MCPPRLLIAVLLCAASIACGATDGSGVRAGEPPSDAAALSSSCAGAMPSSVPDGFSTVVDLGDMCGTPGATSDGASNYAVGKACSNYESWTMLDGSGQPRTSRAATFRTSFDEADARWERHFLAQLLGDFLALHMLTEWNGSAFHRVVSLRSFDRDAVQRHELFLIDLTSPSYGGFPDRSWSIAPVRRGGVQISHVSLPGDGSWHLYTQRFWEDSRPATGAEQLATANSPTVPQHILTGVAIGGEALIAWDNGVQGRAVWTDARGSLTGGTFALPVRLNQHQAVLSPLLDGSLALQIEGEWVGRLVPGVQSMTAAPSWLSTRPKSNLFIVRGGAAYALFTQPPAPDACEQHLVLFAPAGNRCGAIDLPSAQPGPCAAGGEIGQDGTVIVRGKLETYTNDPFPMNRQSYRFFPQLLR